MELQVNDQGFTLTDGDTLFDLLRERGMNNRPGLAVAINEKVIPATDWSVCRLKDGDRVLIIQATPGG